MHGLRLLAIIVLICIIQEVRNVSAVDKDTPGNSVTVNDSKPSDQKNLLRVKRQFGNYPPYYGNDGSYRRTPMPIMYGGGGGMQRGFGPRGPAYGGRGFNGRGVGGRGMGGRGGFAGGRGIGGGRGRG